MGERRSRLRGLHWVKRWIYRGDRPHAVARLLNRYWSNRYRSGGRLARSRDVELEVRGRSSGRPIRFPIVLADVDGAWYAVSMLGADANWVRNVRAAGGEARVRHGGSWDVRLTEVPPAGRAPILKRYLDVAPGARPHFPVDRSAPLSRFEDIAADRPVFRVDGFAPDERA
ncbi:nitroreductase/quinone reductase family protein [Actinomadura parmotrematis]|uniref:Nitroreductase family deazaflavin-dependent oxidoreductase n=1 Tax=Actinomadura parmotrematis TaxID=2864039 RepID=A0ABS7FQS5_9ACTN|nr:nitroreductase/quinone reductase family protein [Actinomadura parmotrematis]MBW8482325.1 nitroreductase family deazaflavin-dependent oxidoreductase [Actinomadura parmotrematis]